MQQSVLDRTEKQTANDAERPGLFGKYSPLRAAAIVDDRVVPKWGSARGLEAKVEMKLLIGTGVVSCGLMYGLVGVFFG